jgi:hypothetical protein
MDKHRRRLDASVEASGPHGFAVRNKVRSSGALLSSTASHPAFRDGCAYAPHVRWDVLGLLLFLPDQKAKNFFGGDWTAQISLNGKGKLRSASMRIWAGIASSLPGGSTGWPQKHLKISANQFFCFAVATRSCYHHQGLVGLRRGFWPSNCVQPDLEFLVEPDFGWLTVRSLFRSSG